MSQTFAPDVTPEPNRARAEFPNADYQKGAVQIETGASPKMSVVTAGNGFQVLSAAGDVLFTVEESGAVTPAVMGIPSRAGAPSPGAPAQFYRDSSNSDTLMYFDGTTAYGVSLSAL